MIYVGIDPNHNYSVHFEPASIDTMTDSRSPHVVHDKGQS